MFNLATPISNLFEDPQAATEIMASSDCLECRDHSIESQLPNQYLFHFDHEIIHPWETKDQLYIKKAIETRRDLKLISFHVASSCSQPVIKEGMYQLGGDKYTRQQMLDFAKRNVKWLRSFTEVDVAIENNNYYATEAYELVTDADFITEITDECDLEFLFDLAHAKITAYNRRQTYETYVNDLPLDRLIQIHLSKHAVNDKNIAYDAHLLPDPEVIQEAGDLIESQYAEYVTVEYYKDKEGLIKTLEALRELKVGLA